MELLVLDQTNAIVNIASVKVVVPGLRHFWSRLGHGRLYTVPVEMGWKSKELDETEMNQSQYSSNMTITYQIWKSTPRRREQAWPIYEWQMQSAITIDKELSKCIKRLQKNLESWRVISKHKTRRQNKSFNLNCKPREEWLLKIGIANHSKHF